MFDYYPPIICEAPEIVHECFIECEAIEKEVWDIPLSSIAINQLKSMSDEELDANWCLNEFFGTIAVINLPSYEKRFKLVTEELKGVGVDSFMRFTGIDGRKELPKEF